MKRIDITGQRFERLVAIEYIKDKKWRCLCDCGAVTFVVAHQLRSGRSGSCGCLRAESMRQTKRKHGMSNTPEWRTYYRMIDRCTNPRSARYLRYGGRGIVVCQRWMESFENFYADMGHRPEGLSIERVDVNGNYEPGNCVWASQRAQSRNTSRTIRVSFQGKEQCLADWASETGTPYGTLYDRHARGLTAGQMLGGST